MNFKDMAQYISLFHYRICILWWPLTISNSKLSIPFSMAGLLPLKVFHSSSWLKNAIIEQILVLFLDPVDVQYKYKEMLEEKNSLLLCSSFAALWIQIVSPPSCNTCNRVHKVNQNIP